MEKLRMENKTTPATTSRMTGIEIRLKVYNDGHGDWVCVGMTVRGQRIQCILMHDEYPARLLNMTVQQYNDLPHHYFADMGVAPKTEPKGH